MVLLPYMRIQHGLTKVSNLYYMSPVDWVCKRISLESASAQLSAITIIACVASVPNRVIAQKLERKRKKTFFPSPSPVVPFFALFSTFSTNSRGNACYAGYYDKVLLSNLDACANVTNCCCKHTFLSIKNYYS